MRLQRILRFFLGTPLRRYRTYWGMALIAMLLVVGYHQLGANSSADQLATLSKVMIVPQEQPEIAIVTDPVTLKSQQLFYVDVAKGDVLFVFPLAGKAVLYRPSTHQVVNAGPIQSTPQPNTESKTK